MNNLFWMKKFIKYFELWITRIRLFDLSSFSSLAMNSAIANLSDKKLFEVSDFDWIVKKLVSCFLVNYSQKRKIATTDNPYFRISRIFWKRVPMIVCKPPAVGQWKKSFEEEVFFPISKEKRFNNEVSQKQCWEFKPFSVV